MYLLDTNCCIALIKGNERLMQRLERHHLPRFKLSAIVLHELRYGAAKSARKTENLAALASFAAVFSVANFEAEDALEAGDVRAALEAAGKSIGPYDSLIAGQARARDLLLITANTREFSRVEGLRWEDWAA
jgi:tRNA(fMet)-specific endonuclease VapC